MIQKILVRGGLGNQMFIYSLYYALRQKGHNVSLDISLYNMTKMHNGYEISKVFEINDSVINKNGFHLYFIRCLLKFNFKKYILCDNDELSMNVFNSSQPYLCGFWQSDKYFSEYRDDILNIFQFKNISPINLDLQKEIKNSNSVSLHIRRGDYLGLSRYSNICTDKYYFDAVSYIKSRVKNPKFYIFSNDLDWGENFARNLGVSYVLVSHNIKSNSYQDMFLMTQCKHNIIANSSFSWWGAYLNRYKDAIKIAPAKWDNSDSADYNYVRVPSNYVRI